MQQNFDNRLDAAEQKLGFLTKFLNPILKMLNDKEFYGLPLRIFYYLIAISNLAIPLGCLAFCGFLFTMTPFFPIWAWFTIPIMCLILIVLSLVIGIGSFAFWLRRLQDIMEYNRHNHTYMSLRNFALMQRTFGEWLGLVIMFLGVTDILTIFIPGDVLGGIGMAFLAVNFIGTIVEAIALIAVGYVTIFLSKVIYDYLEGFANNAADTRDIADIQRMNLEMED